MYRSHTCGELRIEHIGQSVTLCGWVAVSRDLGGLTFIDLRDRYGITQLTFNMDTQAELCSQARSLGREWVIQISGIVRERSSKNKNRPTGDVEVEVNAIKVLNSSKLPPFTIEEDTDGGEELRMKYRYLDIRRPTLQNNLAFRSKVAQAIRFWLADQQFLEIETPVLIKSTPEGARDFIVPSRMHPGQFYALPQSPQSLKQILMVAGMDRYFQIVRCFRDEDLRADRQPEFTQVDCELSFVETEDVLRIFEGLTKHVYQSCLGITLPDFQRMNYQDAMRFYGSDKPDLRFDMKFQDLTALAQGKGFKVFDQSEVVLGIVCPGGAPYTRKQTDELTDWVRRPQIGAKGMVFLKYETPSTIKSSVDKFYSAEQLQEWCQHCNAQPGDLILILSGELHQTRKQLGELRLEMAKRLNLISAGTIAPLWVLEFPLLEYNEEAKRFFACHHPFTSPVPDDIPLMSSTDQKVLSGLRAQAYDLVINGTEIGGGSIRIHDRNLQSQNFKLLGFTPEEAEAQFGFLLGAFEYGAPPHGGIAFGLDRLCAVMSGQVSIRDFIAFPKNNQGRDMMLDAPSPVDAKQLSELGLKI